jgi:hypothetical protein
MDMIRIRSLRHTLLFLSAVIAGTGLPCPAHALSGSFSSNKTSHTVGLALTTGFPQLISAEVRVTSVPHLEFGLGFGGFPANAVASSIYTPKPVPIDLHLTDTYNLYPSTSFSLTGFYAFARWFPGDSSSGFFWHLSFHTVSFSAQLDGDLKDETTGGTIKGALSGDVSLLQPLVMTGPGYQFLFGEHFHLDLGAALIVLFHASSSVNIGGSLAALASLDPTAQANYNAAKASVADQVNGAMATYQSSVKVLPSVYMSLGYLF